MSRDVQRKKEKENSYSARFVEMQDSWEKIQQLTPSGTPPGHSVPSGSSIYGFLKGTQLTLGHKSVLVTVFSKVSYFCLLFHPDFISFWHFQIQHFLPATSSVLQTSVTVLLLHVKIDSL